MIIELKKEIEGVGKKGDRVDTTDEAFAALVKKDPECAIAVRNNPQAGAKPIVEAEPQKPVQDAPKA